MSANFKLMYSNPSTQGEPMIRIIHDDDDVILKVATIVTAVMVVVMNGGDPFR